MAASSVGFRGYLETGHGGVGHGVLLAGVTGIGGSAMRFGWLLPDASYQVLFEGWDRQQYRPRHGKPPLVVRGAYSAAVAVGRARERYLGATEDESLAGAAGRPRSAD